MNKIFSIKNVLVFALLLCCIAITQKILLAGIPQSPTMNSYHKAYQIVPARTYQIDLAEDSAIIWDGHRYVGTIPLWDDSPLDSLMIRDNE